MMRSRNTCGWVHWFGVGVLMLTSLPSGAAAQDAPAGSPIAPALQRAEAAVKAIVAVPAGQRSFDNTVGALDDLLVRLDTDTNMTMFMQYVSTDAAEREASQKAEEHYNNWLIGLFKRDDLFAAVKAYADTNPKLEGEQKRLLEFTLRDFRRAGMNLPPDKREELKRVQTEVNKLGLDFQKNIREDATRVPLLKGELKGLSDEFLATLPRSGEVYLVGMEYPTYIPIMEQCEVESTRAKMWIAYKRRGSARNVALIEQMLKLRNQAATMLGYASPADYETEVRMSKSAAAVKKFYEDLRPVVRRKAALDFAEFTQAKRAHTGDANAQLQAYDFMFYKTYLQKQKYAVDGEKVREYFPMERVVAGLFSVTQSLYGLEYRDVTARAGTKDRPIWHPDAKLYEVVDKKSGEVLGEFYIDMYPRENKYSHAAQWGLAPRRVWNDGTIQRPLAALVCNFTKPTQDKPSLLTHDEVETFFHEFGHCLHTILTETHYGRFAGTAVARDFVEAPSQMFENWVWNADVLKTFARHYQTGEPLPDELLAGMLRARNLGSGLDAERQIYYGTTDLAFHTAPEGRIDTVKTADELFTQIEQYPVIPETFYHASFGHLVGYEAGYYGYMWSLVFAQDLATRFHDKGMLNTDAGMYYREKILSRGGSRDEMDSLRDYLGREPNMDAFLEHLGLKPQ
ncbi:MAG: M3 family metallopeptidase [Phycisphaerae bacterium]